jgi:hypothetical protein
MALCSVRVPRPYGLLLDLTAQSAMPSCVYQQSGAREKNARGRGTRTEAFTPLPSARKTLPR